MKVTVSSEIKGGIGDRHSIAVYPELCCSQYSVGDMFFDSLLIELSYSYVKTIADQNKNRSNIVIVGCPILLKGRLFNCAVVVSGGGIKGIVPKTYLPNTCEYYDRRWFTSGLELTDEIIEFLGERIPIGVDLLFDVPSIPSLRFGIELCEDLWSVKPPSLDMAIAGATLILNLSAGTEQVGKADYRRDLIKQQSARCLCAYAYASAGPNESTTDVVYSGHCLIAENGVLVDESERFSFEQVSVSSNIDFDMLVHERLRHNSFSQVREKTKFRIVDIALSVFEEKKDGNSGFLVNPSINHLRQLPFVPTSSFRRAERCKEIFAIQSTGLARRLLHLGCETITIGISGGLDSTLALLVAIEAFERCGLDRKGIIAVSMPGFGSTDRTQGNAQRLCDLLGVSLKIISIHDAVLQHFKDIGHDPEQHDVTYENSQARERTQILMDLANKHGGITVGTGDLSELALGWCTFNGDHMSMYSVNCGVPKTLVRFLIKWVSEECYQGETALVLRDIIETPITPELLPVSDSDIDSSQKTEELVGPYELHDFFLFHFVRNQFRPRKIAGLATIAFRGRYEEQEILKWLRVFLKRFFSQQFKRSAMPDGPKVGSVALSPRGDWRMPSDMKSERWLSDLDIG